MDAPGYTRRLFQRLFHPAQLRPMPDKPHRIALPLVENKRTGKLDTYCWTFPNPDVTVHFEALDGRKVGYVTYGVSPLLDTILLYNVETEASVRREGYATSILHYVATTALQNSGVDEPHQLSITPIHIVGDALAFWHHARNCGLFVVANEVRVSELDGLKASWRRHPAYPDISRMKDDWEFDAVTRDLVPAKWRVQLLKQHHLPVPNIMR